MSDRVEKQECRILEAVLEGGETSDQISAMVGLPLKTVSAYLSVLCADGLISLKIRNARRTGHRGRYMNVYGPPGGGMR